MSELEQEATYATIRQEQIIIPEEEMLEQQKEKQSHTIGIPKESDKSECRIPLTPQGVKLLIENGHRVMIESGAGNGSNYFDCHYAESGALITESKEQVFGSDIVLKIVPPNRDETALLKPGQLLLSYLYLQKQDAASIRALMNRKVDAIAYEFVKDGKGSYSVLRSMCEIEGYAAISVASEYLSKATGGKGVLLGGITGVPPAEVMIIGASTAGSFAARAALGYGCHVKVFDNSYRNLRRLEHSIGQRLFTSVLHPQAIRKTLKSADAVISSLRYFDNQSECFITKEQIAEMKPGSVIVDLSVGSGTCFELPPEADAKVPYITNHGVILFSASNISSRFARTATIALSNIFTRFLLQLAESGSIHRLLKQNTDAGNGVYIYKGILTNNQVGQHLNIPYKDLRLLMAAF
ncbi:MAG: alanine dehydrogenase [Cytophagaceae bacterium]|jgi:alanine dehydrogenase|nr:alanine dehydrogenase [Cytophagaceae bacterium]